MTDDVRQPGYPPILVLGRDSCEDTTRSRAHLESRGIAFDYHRVDEDPAADAHIRSLNGGQWRTPTILFGDSAAPFRVLREPSNEELDDELDAALGG